jgi:hypothetical protein
MSITDYRRDFLKAVDGKYVLMSVTMTYVDGGARENFEFVISRPEGGDTKTLNIEVPSMTTRAEVIQEARIAAERAYGALNVRPSPFAKPAGADHIPNPWDGFDADG